MNSFRLMSDWARLVQDWRVGSLGGIVRRVVSMFLERRSCWDWRWVSWVRWLLESVARISASVMVLGSMRAVWVISLGVRARS